MPIAALASISLLASQSYFLGSFAQYSFLAQVVSEYFAVAMLWTLISWDQEHTRWSMGVTGLLVGIGQMGYVVISWHGRGRGGVWRGQNPPELLVPTNPGDPLTLSSMIVLLVVRAILTCLRPARRAAGLDPMLALRYE